MDLDTVLVSCDCCNYYKLGDLKETYSPRILEVVSPKSGCWRGHAPSEVSGEGSFLVSSRLWWWLFILGLQHHSSLFIHLHTALYLCVSSSYMDTSHWIQDTLCHNDLTLMTNYTCMSLFPNKATFWDSGRHEFGVDTKQPIWTKFEGRVERTC